MFEKNFEILCSKKVGVIEGTHAKSTRTKMTMYFILATTKGLSSIIIKIIM